MITKYDNEIRIEFLSKSCNEAFARIAVAAFASQLDPTIEEIADIVNEVAIERGYYLININDLTENRRELFGKDNVHPNNNGAAEIAAEVYKFINNL